MSTWKDSVTVEKVSGKQAALLRARAFDAGLKGDQAFLEWLEYESGLDIDATTVEDVPKGMVDLILKRLEADN